MAIDPSWLDLHREEALEADLPIIDCHHHLWLRPNIEYLLPQYVADFGGHNIVASVYVESRSMYRADGAEVFRSVGEVEFANGMAAMSASGAYGSARLCAGIVGYADLDQPEDVVEAQLQRLVAAAPDRLRGIRGHAPFDPKGSMFPTTWAPAGETPDMRYGAPEGRLSTKSFRAGFAKLAAFALSYDSWAYHHQLGDLAELAEDFPDTRIIVNHAGGPVYRGSEADRQEVLRDWKRAIQRLAGHDNVCVKLGGFGTALFGLDLRKQPRPPTSEQLASLIRPTVETCVETFGAARCMFESDFPPDKESYSYPVVWNAFKRVSAGCSDQERSMLFSGAAAAAYRLDPPAINAPITSAGA